MHLNPAGEIKTNTLKRDRAGDRHMIPTTVLHDAPQKRPRVALGVDLGLIRLVQATSGGFVDIQKLYQKSEEKLAAAQTRLARKASASHNREKARIKLAKVHRKVKRQREYLLHRVSKGLVSRADLLVFEGLPIANMVKIHSLAKSIYDASWGRLYQYASYKASSADESAVRADPRGTACDCACGNTVKLSLSDRAFHCPKCGLTIDWDLHGSLGTLRKAGWEAAELAPVEMRPLLAEEPASPVEEAGSPRR